MAMPDLGKMIGPLPLGAWIAIVAVGGGIAYYSWTSSKNEPTVVEDASGEAGVGTGGGQYTYTPPVEEDDGVAPQPTTNTEWGGRAITWLIAQGNPAGASISAITKALAGGTGDNALTAQEYALWELALKKFGSPPDPIVVPPPGSGPGPNPPPKPIPEGPTSPPKATTGFVLETLVNTSKSATVRVRWNRVAWAAWYDVYLNGVWVVARPRSLEYFAWKRPPLKKGQRYTITVITRNILNQKSPKATFAFTMP